MDEERLLFSPVKVHRGWYLIEYAPPIHGFPFATLSLTTLAESGSERIAVAMEEELATWLARYDLPIMASAFDASEDLLRLEGVRAFPHLTGWLDPSTGTLCAHWRRVPSSELPPNELSAARLRRIYSDVPFRTSADLRAKVIAHRRVVYGAKVLAFLGLVVVPAVWLAVEANAPGWLSTVLALYGVVQIYIQALKLLGRWPRTNADLVKAEEELRAKHHHYHCERNPEGVRRLVAENVERETRQKTHEEAERLRSERS